jgi:hypothetical protein
MAVDTINIATENCCNHPEMHHFGAHSVTVTESVARKSLKMVRIAANFGELVEYDGECPIYCFSMAPI